MHPPSRTRRRVLVVEDVPVLRRAYTRLLAAGGSTSQGLEALHLMDEVVPDVILTEVSMPVMDGITMITRLRERGVTELARAPFSAAPSGTSATSVSEECS